MDSKDVNLATQSTTIVVFYDVGAADLLRVSQRVLLLWYGHIFVLICPHNTGKTNMCMFSILPSDAGKVRPGVPPSAFIHT